MNSAPKPPYYAKIYFEFTSKFKTVIFLDYDSTLVISRLVDPDDPSKGVVSALNKQLLDFLGVLSRRARHAGHEVEFYITTARGRREVCKYLAKDYEVYRRSGLTPEAAQAELLTMRKVTEQLAVAGIPIIKAATVYDLPGAEGVGSLWGSLLALEKAWVEWLGEGEGWSTADKADLYAAIKADVVADIAAVGDTFKKRCRSGKAAMFADIHAFSSSRHIDAAGGEALQPFYIWFDDYRDVIMRTLSALSEELRQRLLVYRVDLGLPDHSHPERIAETLQRQIAWRLGDLGAGAGDFFEKLETLDYDIFQLEQYIEYSGDALLVVKLQERRQQLVEDKRDLLSRVGAPTLEIAVLLARLRLDEVSFIPRPSREYGVAAKCPAGAAREESLVFGGAAGGAAGAAAASAAGGAAAASAVEFER